MVMELKDVVGNVHLLTFGDLRELSMEDLKQLKEVVNEEIQTKHNIIVAKLTSTLTEGMEVIVNHKKLAGLVGKITKVNRKKAKVKFAIGNFTVPLSMIEISTKQRR
jgi:transcription antitermination factor NusG